MYSDILYTWLQVNSEWDKEQNIHWIAKKDVKFIDIATELGLSRQTVSTRFKKLLPKDEKGKAGLGLVTFNEALQRYELTLLSKDAAMLVEKNTLRKLVSTLNENSISIYVYLLNRYIANNEQEFDITIDQIKSFIGISLTGRSNNYIVTDILSILKKLGLVRYELRSVVDGKDIKSIYVITQVMNQILDDC